MRAEMNMVEKVALAIYRGSGELRPATWDEYDRKKYMNMARAAITAIGHGVLDSILASASDFPEC